MIEEPRLLTAAEARKLLRISRSSIYRLMADSRLGYVAIGDSRRIPLEEILKFIKTNTVKSVAS